jgi:hypothetical protein
VQEQEDEAPQAIVPIIVSVTSRRASWIETARSLTALAH